MKAARLVVLLALGVAIGFVFGWLARGHNYRAREQTAEVSAAARAVTEISDTWYLLRRLRSGETNELYYYWEGSLDVGIMALGAELQKTPVGLRKPEHLNVLKHLRDYRAKYPHKASCSQYDEAIAQAFALVSTNTAK